MSPPPPDSSPRPKKRTAVAVCMVIMALGVVVWFNWYRKVMRDATVDSNPREMKLEKNLALIDMHGQKRNIADLKGKVIVFCWLYTTCPRGCAGLAVEMKKLQEEFGSHPKFHMVSVTLDPKQDTPEKLKFFAETHGLGGDNWWFVTGEENEVVPWMKQYLGLWRTEVPEAERVSPQDLWYHPVAFRLVDHHGDARGYKAEGTQGSLYYPYHETLKKAVPYPVRQDIAKFLKEAEDAN